MDQLVSGSESKLFHDQLFDIVTCVVDTDRQISALLEQVHKEYDFPWFFETFDLHVHPDLPNVMAADTPPPIDFFYNLPSVLDLDNSVLSKYFVVYALIMEKPGHKSRLSIGSASSTEGGARDRVQNYRKEMVHMFSKWVRKSLDEGFEITHIGILVAFPIPLHELRPLGRSWTLTLEASYTWEFWTLWKGPTSIDHETHYMRHACPWDLEDLDWSGLNSHSPLAEGVKGIALSPESALKMYERVKTRAKINKEKWKQTEKGKAYLEWTRSEEGKAHKRAYYKQWSRSKSGRAYHKRRNLTKKSRPEYRAALDRYNAKMLGSRRLLAAVESGKLELNDEVQKEVEPALKHRENVRARRKRPGHQEPVTSGNGLITASRAILKRHKDRELDSDDEDVQNAKLIVEKDVASSKKYRDKKSAELAQCRAIVKRYKDGELDSDDEDVQNARLVVEDAKAKEKKKTDKRSTKKKEDSKVKRAQVLESRAIMERYKDGELNSDDEDVRKARPIFEKDVEQRKKHAERSAKDRAAKAKLSNKDDETAQVSTDGETEEVNEAMEAVDSDVEEILTPKSKRRGSTKVVTKMTEIMDSDVEEIVVPKPKRLTLKKRTAEVTEVTDSDVEEILTPKPRRRASTRVTTKMTEIMDSDVEEILVPKPKRRAAKKVKVF